MSGCRAHNQELRLTSSDFEEKAFRKSLTKHIGLRKDQATFVSHVPIVDGLSLRVDIVELAPSLCSVSVSARPDASHLELNMRSLPTTHM